MMWAGCGKRGTLTRVTESLLFWKWMGGIHVDENLLRSASALDRSPQGKFQSLREAETWVDAALAGRSAHFG